MGAAGGKGHPAKKAQAGSNERFRLLAEEEVGCEGKGVVVKYEDIEKGGTSWR